MAATVRRRRRPTVARARPGIGSRRRRSPTVRRGRLYAWPPDGDPHPVPWTAPTAAGPVHRHRAPARLQVDDRPRPGAQRRWPTARPRCARPLRARDTELMAAGLRALGAHVSTLRRRALVGRPAPAARPGPRRRRAGRHGHAVPAAGRRAGRRPGHLRRRPARPRPPARPAASRRCARSAYAIDAAPGGGLPLTVHGTGAGRAAARSVIDASASSQFVSGLLLAAAALRPRHRACATRARRCPARRTCG